MPQAAALALVSTGTSPRRWLVVRRPEPPHEWAIPGGMVERGETPAQAAIRELAEETGVTLQGVIPLGVGRDGSRPVHVFVAMRATGHPQPLEGWPVAWATWRQLRVQAVRYGAFLDSVAKTYRTRFGESP